MVYRLSKFTLHNINTTHCHVDAKKEYGIYRVINENMMERSKLISIKDRTSNPKSGKRKTII